MNEILQFLKECGTYYLATSQNGQPHVRPFGTIDLFEGGLYIQTGKSKAVAEQMKQNPKIELCAMAADGRWLRLSATAKLDERIEPQQHMLEAYPSLQKMYQPGDGNTEVYRLTEVTASIYSLNGPVQTIAIA